MEAFQRIAPLHAVQPPYNLFERDVEKDVLPYARKAGATVLAYGALCRGLLSGRITANTRFEGDDLRKVDPKFQQPRLHQYLSAVQYLQRLAQVRYGKSVLPLAVRWILDQGGTVALWGARKPEHLASIDEVLGWSINGADMSLIDHILKDQIRDPIGPEFMAPPARAA
jgi:aryl-alcohol dehydrogenase-like predicted oxidoreductase